MSEETKDIEETKVAEEKKMETEQTILSQPTEKKDCRDSDTDSTIGGDTGAERKN